MSAKHTPGPWRVAPRFVYGATDGIHVDAGSRSYIAHVGEHGDERAEADARLIAAAPDLLAALRELLRDHNNHSIVKAEDAIAKAEAR